MLVPLLAATQAMAENSADQLQTETKSKGTIVNSLTGDPKKIRGYAPMNGLNMYYEIEGTGDPLVLACSTCYFRPARTIPELLLFCLFLIVMLKATGAPDSCSAAILRRIPAPIVFPLSESSIRRRGWRGSSATVHRAIRGILRLPER